MMMLIGITPISAKAKESTDIDKVPVILLHGRSDNSESCFGAYNNITSNINNTYITEKHSYSRDLFCDLEM